VLVLDILLKRGGHIVEGLAQLSKLVRALEAGAGREVAVPDLRAVAVIVPIGAASFLEMMKPMIDARMTAMMAAARMAMYEFVRNVASGLRKEGIRSEGPEAHRAHDLPIGEGDVGGDDRVGAGRRVLSRIDILAMDPRIVVDRRALGILDLDPTSGEETEKPSRVGDRTSGVQPPAVSYFNGKRIEPPTVRATACCWLRIGIELALPTPPPAQSRTRLLS
jgi:hypothetical protein